MQINEYETMVVIRPDLDDPVTYAMVERFEGIITGNGGHILVRDDWGKRKLAYLIDKHQRGHYVLLSHLAPATLVSELERNIRNDDSVIRFMTVKMADDVDVATRIEQAALERERRAEAARARAEAEEQDDEEDMDYDS